MPNDEEPQGKTVPPFPRLKEQQHKLFKQEHKQRAWVGDQTRLVQLQETAEAALERMYDNEIARLGPRPEDEWEARDFDRKVERIGDDFKLSVIVYGKDDRWENSGDLRSILLNADLGDIDKIVMSNRVYKVEPGITIELRSTVYLEGANLKVTGQDEHWVSGAFGQLKEQLSRQSPRWGFLRAFMWPTILTALSLQAILQPLAASVLDAGSWETPEWVLFLVGSIAVYVAALVAVAKAVRWALPSLDVHRPGHQSTSARRIKILGAVGAFVLSTVLIPAAFLILAG
ncbi:hypothetical protein ASG90_20555 [Nocardioides sp. Soil797]|nr:hypothetical protein ASG90_20555 [Nocardioides sp. Soil797]